MAPCLLSCRPRPPLTPLVNESDIVRLYFSASLYEKDLLTFELMSDQGLSASEPNLRDK